MYFNDALNLSKYEFVLNLTSTDQQNDFITANYRSPRHKLKRKSLDVDNISMMSLECKQLLDIFSPPIIACKHQNTSKELCQNGVINHTETLVGIMDVVLEILLTYAKTILSWLGIHIAIYLLGNLEQ